MFAALFPMLGSMLSSVVSSVFPNPEDEIKKQQVILGFQQALAEQAEQIELAGAANVKAEIEGKSWLERNWRPMMMLWFAALIGCRWFGLTVPGITEQVELQLWDIVKIGLGGYVVGHTVENVALPVTKAVIAGKKQQ